MSILLRGIRWRLGASLLMLVTAAIAVGAAVVGPLYLHAAGDSLVRGQVASAAPDARGLTLTPLPGQSLSITVIESDERRLLNRYGLAHDYAAPTATVEGDVRLSGPDQASYQASLVARTGLCAVVSFRAGGCASGPGQAAISTRSAHALGVSVGSILTTRPIVGSRPIRLRITGLYELPSFGSAALFGDGTSLFPFGFTSHGVPLLDSLLVTPATALTVPVSDMLEVPLRPGRLGLANSGRVITALAAAERHANADGLVMSTGLAQALGSAAHQRHLMTTIVIVAALQLVLLAIWVLTALLSRSADLRRGDLRVARLRGFPLASMLAITVSEPALLCLAGAVLGAVGAWIVVVVCRDSLLLPGTSVAPDAWVFAGFAAAVLTIAVILAVNTVGLLRGSDLSRQDGVGTPRRWRTAGDLAILSLTISGLVAASTSGALASHSNPIAVAAPALVALGTSVVAIRVIEMLCRRGVKRTTDSASVPSFLALRQVARRPAQLRESRSLIIALCLACFALSAWSVARTNRHNAAAVTLGAAEVATVAPVSPAALQAAVAHLDAHQTYAMAAISLTTPSSRVLGVQPARLTGVIAWPHGISRAELPRVSRALAPHTSPEVNLSGRATSLALDVTASGAAAGHLSELEVGLWVYSPTAGTTILDAGPLRPGRHVYTGSLAELCTEGCSLSGLGLIPRGSSAPGSGEVSLTLTKVSDLGTAPASTRPVPADLTATQWRAGASGVRIEPAPGGIRLLIPAVSLANDEGAVGNLTPPPAGPADVPTTLPGVAGSTALYAAQSSGPAGSIPATGIDGNSISIRPVIGAAVIPQLGADAEMVNLELLVRSETAPLFNQAVEQVWLSARAPRDAPARLRAAGLSITELQRSAAVLAAGNHTGPALADDFLLLATVLALLTAALATFGALASTRRQRSVEMAGLEVLGVSRPVLAASMAIEAAILALTALFGAGAGVIGAALAIPSLPQLATPTGLPLSYALPVILIVLVTVCVVLLIALASGLAARGILARMSPSLLRASSYDDA